MDAPGRRVRSRRAVITVLFVLCALELAVAGAVVGHRVGDDSAPSSAATATATRPPARSDRSAVGIDATRAGAVRDLLDARAAAVRRLDKSAFLAGIDRRSPKFRAAQAEYFDNLRRVPLSEWAYEVDASTEMPTDTKAFRRYHSAVWAPRVIVHFSLRGFDKTPTSRDTYFTFVLRGSDWFIASDSDGHGKGFRTSRDLWDFGPVSVVRGLRCMVLGHPDSPFSLSELAREVDADIPHVTEVWGSTWSRKVVVIVPSREAELSQILDDGGSLTQIAAVATAEIGGRASRAHPVGDRVLINPVNWAKLGPLGRQVVLTHEITHVASRSASGRLLPTWLVEGLADYVGYRRSGVPVTVGARELLRDLQAGRPLGGLPTEKAYDGTNLRLAQTYEKSWLACRFIAEHWSERKLVSLYRKTGALRQGTAKSGTDATMRSVLGVSLVAFTRQWENYVHTVLL